MPGSYTLELELFATYTAAMPVLEVYEDGAFANSYNVNQNGTSVSLVINYGGALPTSLQFTFLNDAAEVGRIIDIRSVKIDGKSVNVNNYLSTASLTEGNSSSFDVNAADYFFGTETPPAGSFTTGATQTYDGTNNLYNDYTNNTDQVFDMLGGRDVAYLGGGNDSVSGGAGNDILRGGAGTDLLFGDTGDDRVYGDDDADEIYGGDGNDLLHGGEGNDLIFGNADNDTLVGHNGNDTLVGGAGDDRINGGTGTDILYGGADNDRLSGGQGDDSLDGEGGDDNLYGGAGNDIAHGGDNDDIIYGQAGQDILHGDDGDDTMFGGTENDELYGGAGTDFLEGDEGNDILEGANGNDILKGGAGADTLDGGDGDDIIHGHSVNGRTIFTTLRDNPGVVYNADTNSFYQYITTRDTWTGAQTTATTTTLNGINGHLVNITSATENQQVYDLGVANGANNNIGATGGRIWLGANDSVTDQDWFWIDGIEGGMQFSQGSTAVSGLYNNWGGGQPNNSGGAQIYATMWFNGGADDDTWDDRNATDQHFFVIEWEAGLMSDDNAIDTIDGGDGSDTLYGYGGNDILSGGADSDFIFGGDGNDVIDGGGGNTVDLLNGGAGDDDFTVNGNDPIGDAFYGGTGTDEIILSANSTFSLSNVFDSIEFIDADNRRIFSQSGDGFDFTGITILNQNRLEGTNGGNETLTGSESDDRIRGNDGDDILDGGNGIDYVDYANAGSAVTVNLLTSTVSGGAGNDTISNFENIEGSGFNDTLTGDTNDNRIDGNNGDDVIDGGDGDDTINGGNNNDDITGGLGADTMSGGNGDDDFFVTGMEGLGDAYNGNGGTDTIFMLADTYFNTSTTFNNIEALQMGGFNILAEVNGGFNLSAVDTFAGGELLGNTGNEVITGSDSNDVIRGGDGSDTLSGHDGDDDIYGDDGDDIINGNNGIDNLYGGLGADTMNGGNGDDNFYVAGLEGLGDAYNGNGGTDIVYMTADTYFNATTSFNSVNSLEMAGFNVLAEVNGGFDLSTVTTNPAGGELLGNTGNETITGTGGVDTIRGGDGDDILNGGGGIDTIYGENDDDTINAGGGDDVVYGGDGADILNGDGGNDDFYITGTEGIGDVYDGGNNTDEIFLLSNVTLGSGTSFTNMETLNSGGFIITAVLGSGFDLSDMAIVGLSDLRGDTGNETITGSSSDDLISGLAGADILSGFNGVDTINGDAGTDTINGGAGNDIITGGADADILNGDGGNDDFYVTGSDGIGDTYDGGGNTDELFLLSDVTFDNTTTFTNMEDIESGGFFIQALAGTGFDLSDVTITGGSDLRGDTGNETITGSASNDVINGYGGIDTLNGFNGNDDIYGGAGADILNGGDGQDNFYIGGTEGIGDQFDGGNGNDDELWLTADATLDGTTTFTNMEQVVFNGFKILVSSGATVDLSSMTRAGTTNIEGAAGNETIHGTQSNDAAIEGFGGNDTLYGEGGRDNIYGGLGDDILYGGDGRDELYGEGGADTFVLENATAFNDVERIRDFSLVDNDVLDIQDLLTGYTFGVDTLTDFVQIVDAGANSNVFVDTTGTGSFAGNQVATLFGITGLTDEVALETSGNLVTN